MKAITERILRSVLPRWARESVIGDLDEEFRRAVAGGRGRAATWWYVRNAAAIAVLYGWQRLQLRSRDGSLAAASGRITVRILVDCVTDSRLALRQMARRPAFAAAAILTLGIGVAANSTAFSLVNTILFKPLTSVEPDRVVRLMTRTTRGAGAAFAYSEFVLLRDAAQRLTDVAAVHLGTTTLRAPGVQDQLLGELASAGYFRIRQPSMLLGRTLVDADDTPGSEPAVMLAERYWRRTFGADPASIGRAVSLNGRAFTVVGIVREEFGGSSPGAPVDLWIPLEHSLSLLGSGAAMGASVRPLQLLARLAPGATVDQAQHALGPLAEEIGRGRGDAGNLRLELVPGTLLHGRPREMAVVLLSVVLALTSTVLLVAASNVANLLLARAISRRRDVAVRVSLGAGRGRILRQTAVETLVLALCAGLIGLLVARWVADTFSTVALLPGFELRLNLSPDWRVAGMTAAISLLAGLIAAVGPAVALTRGDLTACLKEGGGSVGSRRTSRLRATLVIAQVAIASIVAVAAGLLVKSGAAAAATDLGFRTADTFATDIDLTVRGYTEERSRAFYRELVDKVAALPGVSAVAVATRAPLDSSTPGLRVLLDGETDRSVAGRPHGIDGSYYVVSPAYFETVGITLTAGRGFGASDGRRSSAVAVINEAFAARLWPSQRLDAIIGKRFRVARGSAAALQIDDEIEVIGVARNAKYRTVGEELQPHVYLLAEQHAFKNMALLVRSATSTMPMIETQAAIASIDPQVQGFFTRTLEQHTRVALLPARFAATVSGVTGAVAALLGAIGLYGLIASIVSERHREFAVRLALGATPSTIWRQVLRQGMMLAAGGGLLGLVVAGLGGSVLTSLLYFVSPRDPAVYATVMAGVLVVAIGACWMPARRASRIVPLAALRE